MHDDTFIGNGDETWNNPTNTPNPLLLWMTVNADYHCGVMSEFAAFAAEARDISNEGASDDKIVEVHVLGADGPKLASFTVSDDTDSNPNHFPVRITCPSYEIDFSRVASI